MKKSKLLIEASYDFDLLGLVAPLKDYKIAWLINRSLGLELKRDADYTMEFTNQPTLVISQYLLEREHGFIQLLRNKSYPVAGQARFLIPELKIMDYFLIVQDPANGLDLPTCMDELSKIKGIQNVVKLDVTKLKSRDNLLTY
jgi:hypothetical protein